jgi:Mannosyl-glycoprotein endo-beta-N-acetylglucosaminidase
MLCRVGAFVVLASFSIVSATSVPAAGPDLPDIVAGPDNAVPQCVTPGRLMVFLKQRNPQLDPRYDGIATQYMRFGEQLGVRWDYAFYQMVVETGALSYWRGNRHGDVKPEQNNFAGLGATGGGERGESFKDIEGGVRAHIEHILLYAGRPVADPVAERTRKVHQWGLLTSWQGAFKRPITYADLATKWAPGNRTYVGLLQTVAERFQNDLCRTPDPRPQLVQEARTLIAGGADAGNGAPVGQPVAQPVAPADTAPSVIALGKELMQRVFDPKADPNQGRSALGAPPPPAEPPPPAAQSAAQTVPYKVLNTPPADTQAPQALASSGAVPPAGATPAKSTASDTGIAPADPAPARPAVSDAVARTADTTAKAAAAPKAGVGDKTAEKTATRFALAGTAATAAPKTKLLPDTAVPPAANQKCRVWTASYGGQKSIIIRSIVDQVVNFTVLDVNVGQETHEAEAFIAAYAKNGKIAGEYSNQAQALDKAFELCPEG